MYSVCTNNQCGITFGSNLADFPVTNAVFPFNKTIAKPCNSLEQDISTTDCSSPNGWAKEKRRKKKKITILNVYMYISEIVEKI